MQMPPKVPYLSSILQTGKPESDGRCERSVFLRWVPSFAPEQLVMQAEATWVQHKYRTLIIMWVTDVECSRLTEQQL